MHLAAAMQRYAWTGGQLKNRGLRTTPRRGVEHPAVLLRRERPTMLTSRHRAMSTFVFRTFRCKAEASGTC